MYKIHIARHVTGTQKSNGTHCPLSANPNNVLGQLGCDTFISEEYFLKGLHYN